MMILFYDSWVIQGSLQISHFFVAVESLRLGITQRNESERVMDVLETHEEGSRYK